MIIQIDSDHPQPRRIRQMVDTLKEGELVAYPTDTVYGVGCDITSHDALVGLREFVSEFKDEPDHAPLSFICESLSQVAEYAHVDDEAHRFLRRALPGPFTFILEASKDVPSVMRKHRDTVGVRIPEHAITARLIERLGNPLATTTAMTREGDLVHDPWTLDDLYGHRIEIVADGGYVHPEPSTVVDLSGEEPVLIRRGKGDLAGLPFVEVD